ncbi:MAG: flagellar hook-associated protein FlgL [bacterium]
MRITNSITARSQFEGLAANMAALLKAQTQATTGKRIQVASDDPTASVQIMNSDSSLRALDQYRTNVQRASSRVDQEDSVLQQMGDLLSRAKELGASQATATASDQTRSVANAEVQQIFQEIAALGNTKFGNEFLFGGEQSQTAPFTTTGSGATLDYTATASQGTRSVAIGAGQTMAIAHDGKQLLLDSGVLDAVKQLSHAMDPASPTYGQTGIGNAITSLNSSFNSVQSLVGDVGAKGLQLNNAQQNLDAYKTNLTTFASDLSEINVEQAVTEMTNRQVAYQAAMLATNKVMSLNLADYLK